MKRYLIISAMLFLVIGMCIPQPAAAAFHDSGTMTAQDGEFIYFNIHLSNDGTLSYTVSRSSGDPNFDVFFIESSYYEEYQSQQTFYYITDCTKKDTGYARVTCSVDSGSYYLLLDNTEVGDAENYYGKSVTFTYSVDATEGSNGNGGDDDSFLYYMICGFIGFFILIVIIAVAVTRMKRKKSVAYKVPSTPAPTYQSSYTQTQPQSHYQQPQHSHSHAPPPQTPAGYKAAPREQPTPAYSPPPEPTGLPEAKQPEEPPKLVLPGMMGGTKDTLEDAYSGPPKPKQPPKF